MYAEWSNFSSPIPSALGSLNDVAFGVNVPMGDDVLTYTANNVWEPQAPSVGSTTLSQLSDVDFGMSGPQHGQILVYSGYSTTRHTNTESWDGSSWTELSDLNTSRYTGGDGGAGPSDAICAGGQPDSPGRVCEFWDGTTWSEGADLNTVRIEGAASASASTSAIYGGGNNPGGTALDTVEYYNGSSWSEIADLADGGNGASHHIGSAHDTFFAGGISPSTPNSASTSTEHFTAPGAVATVTTS